MIQKCFRFMHGVMHGTIHGIMHDTMHDTMHDIMHEVITFALNDRKIGIASAKHVMDSSRRVQLFSLRT